MKRLFIAFISMLIWVFPTVVFAHTELSSSTPESGQVVTKEMKEITLLFGGEIESLSTMKLVKDGQEIQLKSVLAQGNQLIGLLGSPLENGSYIINWNIAGEDGHPITGDIPFSVQVPEEEQDEQVEEVAEEEQNHDDNENATESKNESTNNNNMIKIIIPLVAILLLVFGLVTLFRKKK